MATYKKVKRKRGEAYQIFFIHPLTGKKVRKIVWCSKKDAERIVKKIEADIALGQFNIESDSSMNYSWSQLEKKYKAHSAKNKSPKTTKREEVVLKSFNAFLGNNPKLDEVTKNVIETYRDHRLESGIKPATVGLELRSLKVIFNCGIDWDMVDVNPVVKVRLPKTGNVKVRFLRVGEINALLNVIQEANDRPFERLVLAYINTGARRIEILAPQFTWDNVHFKDRKIEIAGLKGNGNRYIPMNRTLFHILKEIQKEGHEYPFGFKPDTVSHKIAEYYKLAKIKGANLHSLRKTFGSLLIQSKSADLYTVSRLLGHSSVRTTEKYYIDLLDENYRQPLDSLSQLIKSS